MASTRKATVEDLRRYNVGPRSNGEWVVRGEGDQEELVLRIGGQDAYSVKAGRARGNASGKPFEKEPQQSVPRPPVRGEPTPSSKRSSPAVGAAGPPTRPGPQGPPPMAEGVPSKGRPGPRGPKGPPLMVGTKKPPVSKKHTQFQNALMGRVAQYAQEQMEQGNFSGHVARGENLVDAMLKEGVFVPEILRSQSTMRKQRQGRRH